MANRTHFFAVASRVMRQILVDSARSHLRAKRGGGAVVLSLDEELIFVPERSADLVALDHALDLLAEVDRAKPRLWKCVSLAAWEQRKLLKSWRFLRIP